MPITPGMSRLFVLLVTALLFAAAHAAERSLWVDAKHGRDSAPGTKARPLRTVDAAWRRVPQGVALRTATASGCAPAATGRP